MCRHWPWLSSRNHDLSQLLCNGAITDNEDTAVMAAWLSSADGQKHRSRIIGMLRTTLDGHAGVALHLGALAYAEHVVALHDTVQQPAQRRPCLDDLLRVLSNESATNLPALLWQTMANCLYEQTTDSLARVLLGSVVADKRSPVDHSVACYFKLRLTQDHDGAVAAVQNFLKTTMTDGDDTESAEDAGDAEGGQREPVAEHRD